MKRADTNGLPDLPQTSGEELMLPWYVNQSLSEQERATVEAWLASAARNRTIRDQLIEIRWRVREAVLTEKLPPNLQERACRNEVEPLEVAGDAPPRAAAIPANGFRLPGWAAAVACALIVMQAGGLVWLANRTVPSRQEAVGRSVKAPVSRLRIWFAPDIREPMMRSIVSQLGGRIVDGPDEAGSFVLELSPADPRAVSWLLVKLQQPGSGVSHMEMVAQ